MLAEIKTEKRKKSLLDFPSSDKLNRGQGKLEQQVEGGSKREKKNQIKGKNLPQPKLLWGKRERQREREKISRAVSYRGKKEMGRGKSQRTGDV